MARLKSLGFELNSTATGIEVDFVGGANPPTIQTSIVRSGTYAATQTNSGGNDGMLQHQFRSANATEAFYFRLYVYITAAPNTNARLITIWRTSTTARKVSVRLTNGRALQLFNEEDSAQIGSDSSALSLNTWYRVELKVDTTTIASTAVEARVDGVSFASGTIDLTSGIAIAVFGMDTLLNSGSIRMEDIAINDATGSSQNSWPGAENIIHLKVQSNGDTNNFNSALGASHHYLEVDETTPDDATSYLASDTSGDVEDFNIEPPPAAISATTTINVVHVGVRFRSDSTTDPDPTFVLRVKAAASGTVEESASITSSSTTWSTNSVAAPKNYPLTLYDLPGASTTAWGRNDLEQAQIGARVTNSPFPDLEVSTVWMVVGYTPDPAASQGTINVDGNGGDTAGWRAEGGDYTRVDDVGAHDGDTTRLYTPTANDLTSFTFGSSGLGTETINGVTVYAVVKSADPVSSTFQIYVKVSGTDYFSPTFDSVVNNTGYLTYSYTWLTNPNTTSAWTVAEVNALEAGLKKINAAGQAVTQMYAIVDYSAGGGGGGGTVTVSRRMMMGIGV